MRRIPPALAAAAVLLLLSVPASRGERAEGAMSTKQFEFVSGANRLAGLVDEPANGDARAMIVIIHGYGPSDIGRRTTYYDLRARFTQLGIATLIWDKPGCGQSGGRFDPNQPVASSAREVVDAIRKARENKLPGSQRVGLWGISRAGWIAPLAIAQDPRISFWISVSGTDDQESFPYFLESNLRLEGRSALETKVLLGAWRKGFEITRRGGTFEDYLAATRDLRRDPFMVLLSGGRQEDRASFLAEQKQYSDGTATVSTSTGLMVYVPQFPRLLSHLDIPVLAIFGEKDCNVDWRRTRSLYSRTIGENPHASLTIRIFADANHNLQVARTGGLREMLETTGHRPAPGYYEAMSDWLRAKVLD